MGHRRHSAAGFTVIEMVVALFVMAVVLVGMLALFDASNRIARTQVHVADMQQSLRIGHDEMVRMARIAARGWVINNTSWKPEDQIKLAVDNAGPAVYIGTATDPEYKVLPGTDVLRIRGVIVGSLFENEIGQENSCAQNASPDPLQKGGCSIEPDDLLIKAISRSGLKQDLDQLERAMDDGNGNVTVLLVSKQGEVATTDAEITDVDKTGNTITSASIHADPTIASSSWVDDLEKHPIALTGIVEEYAFYIRENDGKPRLAMARFKPGTDEPYGGNAHPENLRQDIADDIIDLQVALGVDKYTDTNGDGFIDALDHGDGVIAADEWFYAGVAGAGALPDFGTKGDLQLVRISTLARTQGRDFQYVSKPIVNIENHTYNETTVDPVARSYRRRVLQTVLNLRNM
jgi:competence protein ComGC